MGAKKQRVKAAVQAFADPSPEPPQDDTLLDDLLSQLDSPNPTVQQESAVVLNEVQRERVTETAKKSSKTRFKEREARRNAAMAANYGPSNPEDEARIHAETQAEAAAIAGVCTEKGLVMREISPDGHCLFAAIADQLVLLSLIVPTPGRPLYMITRHAAADFILSHPDDFLPFLPSPEGEDGQGATGPGIMTLQGLQKYCDTIRNTGTWGGEPEITALARAFRIPIQVVQWGSPSIVTHFPESNAISQGRSVMISYHRRMYGLGEHYNSLRPIA